MKKVIWLSSFLITVLACSKDDDGGNCLVCDKSFEKDLSYTQDGSETVTLKEYTWEETLSMFQSEGLCVGSVDAFAGGEFNKQTLEMYKVTLEKDGSVCSFQ